MRTPRGRISLFLSAALAATAALNLVQADWRDSQWKDLPPLGPDFVLSGEPRSIPLRVTNTASVDVAAQPVRGGVPFPKSVLTEPLRLRLTDAAGQEAPLQALTLARWPDNSVKWLLLDFQTGLKAGETRVFKLEFGAAAAPSAKPAEPVTVARQGATLRVSTGPLAFVVAPGAILRDVTLNGKPVTSGPVDSTLTLDGFSDKPSGEYRLGEGKDWSVAVEEEGPLHAILRLQARHRLGDQTFSPSIIRIHAFAGAPFVALEHLFVFSGDPLKTRLRSLAVNVPLRKEGAAAPRAAFGQAGAPAAQTALNAAATLFQDNLEPPANPPFTSFRPRYQVRQDGAAAVAAQGDKAPGWMRIDGTASPCLLGARYFWQLLPKGLEAAPREDEVVARAWLYPPQAAPLDLRRKDQRFPEMMEKLAGPLYKHYQEFLKDNNATGLGRTHELLLDFSADSTEAERRFAVFTEPPLLAVSPAWNAHTRALGRFHPYDPANFPDIEKAMSRMLEWMMRHQSEWSNWYGFTDFGCMQYRFLPDQGRWDNLDGKMGWKNDELNNAHTVFLAYLRTGRPEYARFAESLVRHTMDIDSVHYDPSGQKLGLQRRHSYDHWSGHVNAPHTFLLAMRDFYFLTGNRQAVEQIRMAADWVIRHPSHARSNLPAVLDRSGDAPMWNAAAAYEATGEAKYREEMLKHLALHEEGMGRVLRTPVGLKDSDWGADWFFYDYKCFALTLMERLLEDGRALKLMVQGSREFKNATKSMYMPWPQILAATGDRSLITPLLMDSCFGKDPQMRGPVEKDTYTDPFSVCHGFLERLPYHMAGFYDARPKELILKIVKGRKAGPEVKPLPNTHFVPIDMAGVMNRNPLDDPYGKQGGMASKKPRKLKPGEIGFDFGFVSGCAPGYLPVSGADHYPSFAHMRVSDAFLGLPFGATSFLGGIPFDLVNPFQNGGRGALVLEKNQAATIPVNRKAARLHFLGHVSGNSDYKDGRVGAEYVIRFASGAVQRVPLACLRDYAPADFTTAEPTDSRLVGNLGHIAMHRFELVPNEADIREIEARDTGEGEMFTLLAVTAEVSGAAPAPEAARREVAFDAALPYEARTGAGWRYPERLTVDKEGRSVRSSEPNVLRVDLPDGWYRVDLFTGQSTEKSHWDVTMIETGEAGGWDAYVIPEIRTFDRRSRSRTSFPVLVAGGRIEWRFSTRSLYPPQMNLNWWTLHKLAFTPIAAPARPPLGFPKASLGPAFGWVTDKTAGIECTLRDSVRNPMDSVWEDFVRPYRPQGGEIHEFAADAPNGVYDAELRIGRGFNSQQILDISAEGKVVIAGEMFKDQPGPQAEPPARRFRVKIEDSRLNMRFELKQRGGIWTLYSLILTPVAAAN